MQSRRSQTTTTTLQTTSAGSATTRSIARETEPTSTETLALTNPATADCCTGATGGSLASEPPRTAVSAPAAAPLVTIETPVDRATFAAGATVIFSAVARDLQDGDLSARIVWTSSRDGRIGTGSLLHKELSAGTHIITASVTDASGTSRSAQITIVVSP